MTDLLYGRKPVLEALRGGSRAVHRIHLMSGAKDDTVHLIEAQAKSRNIPVSYESRHKLDSLAGHDHHQGVLAVCEAYQYDGVQDLIHAARDGGEAMFVVALDELEDPQNLGAILRTAEACGVHGVLLPKNRAVGVTPSVVKTSAGAADHVRIALEANLVEALRKLKEAGAWVVGADAEGATEFHRYDFTRPTVIVMGSEGKGLRRLVREHCDDLLKIPMYGKVSSLNASVSAALLMYEVVRQRRWKAPEPKPPEPTVSWAQPDHDGPEASRLNEFFGETRPPEGSPDRGVFLRALAHALRGRLKALLGG